jgi:protein-L-isoaspartate(D-aspartate) O-methyltransferase
MIVPVGERYQQNLYRLIKRNGKLQREALQATLFVPMTGEAESSRQVQPDPLHPAVRNGGFEQVVGNTDQPLGWHYVRQAKAISQGAETKAPEGDRWLRFTNAQPGRASQALQGMAVDGRRVSRLRASCQVQASDIKSGPDESQRPGLIVTYYDERRAVIGNEQLGPWSGSFPWRPELGEFRVPLAAREAILRIGLHGAAGVLDVDQVQLSAEPAPSADSPK